MGILRILGHYSGWLFGVMGVLGAPGFWVEFSSPGAAVLLLVGSLLLIPPIRERMPAVATGKVGIAAALVFWLAAGVVLRVQESEKAKSLGYASVEEYQKAKQNGSIRRTKAPAGATGALLAVQPANAASPADAIEKTVVTDDMPPFKKSVEVYLKHRISRDEIAAISNSIRADAGSSYQKVFVGFRLPDGAPTYWATAHHAPQLEVVVMGMSQECEHDANGFAANIGKSGEKVVATALFDGPGAKVLAIVDKGGKYFRRTIYFDCGKTPVETELDEDEPLRKDASGSRYRKAEGNSGTVYVVTADRIEIRDDLGLIAWAKRL